ncbi:MAG: hypothetical protein ACTSSG_08040 [Candidatus Heimdallarchaeaceae archaeon]
MSFTKKFKDIFRLTIWEAIIAFLLIGSFFILRFLSVNIIVVIVLGFIAGVWLTFRPSEWAVEGLDSASKYIGMTDYVSGIISSLASNLPEAVIAIFIIVKAQSLNLVEKIGQEQIAIITVLSAAGFNTLILGASILIATFKNKGRINVPEDLEKKEAPIIRWAIVALSVTVLFGVLEYVQGIGEQETATLNWPVTLTLALSYVFYLVYISFFKENGKKETKEEKEIVEEPEAKSSPHLGKKMTVFILLLGFVGIFFGGEALSYCVEELVHITGEISPIFLGLILGAAGALPEHGIALVSAAKDEVELAIGNAIGGILQSSLLIFGIIGIIIVIPLSPFIILQLAAVAAVLWFTKRCIFDDRKFDAFEGIMILLLQIFVFIILIEEAILVG